MDLERAQRLSSEVVEQLAPYCKKIIVAGSVRRMKAFPRDIDIVLIPSDPFNLATVIAGLGPIRAGGDKLKSVFYDGTQVDIYYAGESTWATLLLIRTGSAANNRRLATRAQKKGWRLYADGRGLFDETGKRVAGDTEESIFEALGLRYLKPEERS